LFRGKAYICGAARRGKTTLAQDHGSCPYLAVCNISISEGKAGVCSLLLTPVKKIPDG